MVYAFMCAVCHHLSRVPARYSFVDCVAIRVYLFSATLQQSGAMLNKISSCFRLNLQSFLQQLSCLNGYVQMIAFVIISSPPQEVSKPTHYILIVCGF